MNESVYMDDINVASKNKNIAHILTHKMYLAFKRIFDFVLSFIGCLLLLPIALIIKICYILNKDYNKIFFTQDRIGKNGKKFKLYKFRTMVPDADKILFEMLENNPEIAQEYKINKKLKDDPRITKVGKILRKLSIDELPQVINILKGDMSFIGNRPYLPREKEDMGKYYNTIIKTRPGLTGYWQVSGRSNVTFEKRLELESYYSNHYSFHLDVKIFFKTFKVVLFGKDAK